MDRRHSPGRGPPPIAGGARPGPSGPLLAVLALFALAGCAEVAFEPRPDGPPGTIDDVRVTGVVDGDTIDVRFPDGTTDRVRLVGVDTPEVHVAVDPEQYPDVPDTTAGRDCLRAAGHDASNFTRARIGERSVGLAYDSRTDRRGGYDRLLAYVVVGNGSLNYDLVRSGHARVYETEFTRRDRYEDAMAAARREGRGLWRCVSSAGQGSLELLQPTPSP